MMQSRQFTRSLKGRLVGWLARLVARPPITAQALLKAQPKRILIVRQHNQMGDMICATPALRAIRETFPEATLALVTAPVNVEVVRHNPHVDQILTFDRAMWRNPARLSGFWRDVRGFRPDLAFVLSSVSFSVTSAAIALASGARWVVGGDSAPFGWDVSDRAFSLEMPSVPELDRHAVQHSLAPLQAIGITTEDHSTVVVPSSDETKRAQEIIEDLGLSDGFWAVHPGAGKKQNIWPATAFAEVIRQAVADGRQVLVLHGPADVQELAHLMDLLSDIPAPNICVAPAAPIGVGAALLQHANRFLCNDTGVMHLAGAVNTPTIALFGPTDPKFWKPPTEAVQAVCSDHQVPDDRGPEFGWMEQIPVQRVWQAWRSLPTPTDKF